MKGLRMLRERLILRHEPTGELYVGQVANHGGVTHITGPFSAEEADALLQGVLFPNDTTAEALLARDQAQVTVVRKRMVTFWVPDEPGAIFAGEADPRRWSAFASTLKPADHKRLIISLGAGLREARLASYVATSDGDYDDARRHVITAIIQLRNVLQVIATTPNMQP